MARFKNDEIPSFKLHYVTEYTYIAKFQYDENVIKSISGVVITFNNNAIDAFNSFVNILYMLEVKFEIYEEREIRLGSHIVEGCGYGYRFSMNSNVDTKEFRLRKVTYKCIYEAEWSNATVPLPNFTLDNKHHKNLDVKVIAVISL